MDIRDVKKNLNRRVLHKNRDTEGEYLFVACIIRKHRQTSQFYYEAQLQDIKHDDWLLNCPLNEIEEVKP